MSTADRTAHMGADMTFDLQQFSGDFSAAITGGTNLALSSAAGFATQAGNVTVSAQALPDMITGQGLGGRGA